MKSCSKCNETKPLSEFSKNKNSADGLQNWCKFCSRAATKANRIKRIANAVPPVTQGTKICSKCRLCKTVSQFYLCIDASDGLTSRCKECSDLATKESNARRNPSDIKAVKQAWYTNNHEYILAHYATKKLERSEISRRWAKNNPEKRKAADRKRKQSPQGRLYNQVYTGIRRARKKAIEINDFTRGEWLILKDEFAGMCAYCGIEPASLTQDHIIPIKKMGSHTYENIVPACKSCNSRKGAKDLQDFLPLNSGLEVRYDNSSLEESISNNNPAI